MRFNTKEIIKNTKGITLIALVVTIIILLILAGITISAIASDNGLFEMTKKAKNNTIDAQNKENEILSSYLDAINGTNTGGNDDEELAEVKIDDELAALLREANMTITLEDILNAPGVMENVIGLIPTLTESDVTRSEVDGVITYTDSYGGIIRTNSEYYSEGDYAWNAFDSDINTLNSSKIGEAEEYYLEYEFVENVYALQIKYIFTNGSKYEGTRQFVIQGYDEDNSEWKDISEDLTWTGNHYTKKEEAITLNYTKPYKKYRVYVKDATYTSTSNGAYCSGFYKMQLYGGISSKIDKYSEENLKQLLLSNTQNYTITLSEIITNTDFSKRLINALSIETIANNQTLMANLPGLIPTLTADDVTRSEVDGVVTYTDNTGGITRTNSEDSGYSAWYAFDDDLDTHSFSKAGEAEGNYLEYEFSDKVYALQIKYIFTNGSSKEGTRKFVIQGYDEGTNSWNDLTEELTWIGTYQTKTEETVNLNYLKPYNKYRVYVTEATYTEYEYAGYNNGLHEMQLYGKTAN